MRSNNSFKMFRPITITDDDRKQFELLVRSIDLGHVSSVDQQHEQVPSHATGMFIDDYCQKPNFYESTFKLEELEETELLVKQMYTTVNPLDGKLRRGEYVKQTFPLILGKESSGIVVKVGSKVNRFKVGDNVCGFLSKYKTGSYSNYVIFDESDLVMKPKEMSFEQAVAFPVGGRCVMEMFSKHPLLGKVLERESQLAFETGLTTPEYAESDKIPLKVLVNGASGGCGSVACLIAANFLRKYFKITLLAVCSTRNIEYVKSLGVDHVVDYTKTSAKAGPQTTHKNGGLSHLPSLSQLIEQECNETYVDIFLDCVGGYYYYDDICRHMDVHLAKPFVFVTISTPTPNNEKLNVPTMLRVVSFVLKNKAKSVSRSYPQFHMVLLGTKKPNPANLELVMNHAMVTNSCFTKLNLEHFSLDKINDAHEHVESGRTVGKIVVKVPSSWDK